MTVWLRRAGTAMALAGMLAGGLAASADAATRRAGKSADGYQWVTAHSDYSVNTISAPTRPSKWGREVRLPGGSWIDCAGDCRDTLREATIDFWFEQNNRGNELRIR